MLGQKRNPKAAAKSGAGPLPTMKWLWHQVSWGAAAALALFVAVLSIRSEVGAERTAVVLASLGLQPGHAVARPAEEDGTVRELTQAVHTLTADRDRLIVRLAAVEHDIEDMTGSIKQQIQASGNAAARTNPPWPDDAPPVPMTPADIAAMVKPIAPPATDPPRPSSAITPAAADLPADAVSGPPPYGADIGSAASIKALHAHWVALRSAHPQLFDGLQPVVSLRDSSRSKRIELHLVVGPFSNAEAAAQLCGLLVASRIPCQPAMFDGPHLALQ